MDTYPISSNSLEKFYNIDGNQFGQQYKEFLSDFENWDQKKHAEKWMLFSDNIGECLSIDETALTNGELYIIVTNKSAKGKKGAIVAMIAGTNSNNVISILEKIPVSVRYQVKEVTLDMASSMNKIVKRAYTLSHKLRLIFSKTTDKGVAYTKLARWHQEVDKCEFDSFKTIVGTVEAHYQGILNFFDNRSTNASAESFNAKLKAFRASMRGVTDISFFLFRIAKIYA